MWRQRGDELNLEDYEVAGGYAIGDATNGISLTPHSGGVDIETHHYNGADGVSPTFDLDDLIALHAILGELVDAQKAKKAAIAHMQGKVEDALRVHVGQSLVEFTRSSAVADPSRELSEALADAGFTRHDVQIKGEVWRERVDE